MDRIDITQVISAISIFRRTHGQDPSWLIVDNRTYGVLCTSYNLLTRGTDQMDHDSPDRFFGLKVAISTGSSNIVEVL